MLAAAAWDGLAEELGTGGAIICVGLAGQGVACTAAAAALYAGVADRGSGRPGRWDRRAVASIFEAAQAATVPAVRYNRDAFRKELVMTNLPGQKLLPPTAHEKRTKTRCA